MKAVYGALLLLLAGCVFDSGEEPKQITPGAFHSPVFDPDPPPQGKQELKIDDTYLQKTWGIKVKSFKVEDRVTKQEGRSNVTYGPYLRLLLEFTKDVTDPDELKAMREAFLFQITVATVKPPKYTHYFHFFDDENVQLQQVNPSKLEGYMTGTKGDAFRVFLSFDDSIQPKTRKVEMRPVSRQEKKTKPELKKG